MSRGICPRVNSCGSFWILSAVIFFAATVIDVDAYSCHEVRTAFQMRQVGPLHRVPETPVPGEPVGLASQSEGALWLKRTVNIGDFTKASADKLNISLKLQSWRFQQMCTSLYKIVFNSCPVLLACLCFCQKHTWVCTHAL